MLPSLPTSYDQEPRGGLPQGPGENRTNNDYAYLELLKIRPIVGNTTRSKFMTFIPNSGRI